MTIEIDDNIEDNSVIGENNSVIREILYKSRNSI